MRQDTVSFQSKGLIDPRCITTIGVSVKETDNPIGFFGTGLKYAIAILLRSHGEVTIWRGLEPYRFTTQPVEIRGKTVDMVCMNDQELGFTTDLGKHWQMWQAFREIYCNTQDEGGEASFGKVSPTGDTTTVHVVCEEFADCFRRIDDYILTSEPIYRGPGCAFHSGPVNAIFYRSIQVYGSGGKQFRFTPNVTDKMTLTEDRTLRYPYEAHRAMAKAVLEGDDDKFLERWLTTGDAYSEHEIDLDWDSIKPSSAFLKVARRIAQDRGRTCNKTMLKVLSRHEPLPPIEEADLLGSEAHSLRKAVQFCRDLKFPVDEFPISVVESLGEGILGRADKEKRAIYIARRCFQDGDLMLASTLIEEWAHIKHGYYDCTREFQNWIFGALVRMGQAYLFERDQNARKAPHKYIHRDHEWAE